ncbi:MAG: isoprenyl transferase [Candidatus Omnitrophica bacterium]|nr:isoprenyl transferase [Candidatus Omnitrophota bacterium]
MSAQKIIPEHIAIIMDGNGRWANKRRLPRIAGHSRGAKVIKSIVQSCDQIGVKYLTLYTFSTENWKRPEQEVNFLMQLLSGFLAKEIQHLVDKNIQFSTIGRIEQLPKKAQEVIAKAKDKTKNNTGITLILALNYGGRSEILNAAIKLYADIETGKVALDKINEKIFAKYLYTAGIPDPDLLIRTSGEMRISNFLLWQLSYSEFYITEKFWPDFDETELKLAINCFQKRKRRFGGIEHKKG